MTGRVHHPLDKITRITPTMRGVIAAADVRVAPALVRVDERAGAGEAGSWVDDLVAVHLAAAALHLVLRTERQRADGGLLGGRHTDIVRGVGETFKT